MGHNVFLIAQVKARGSQHPAYRCVGGYHKHDCYGTLPLRALLRFFTLLRQSDNADVIREEIHALDGQYGQPGEDPKSPNVPCRFLSTVLGSAWDVLKRDLDIDVGGTYLYQNILSANSKFWGEHCGDGVTVVDVTDPQNPGCSLFERGNTKPLTPLEYLTGYYPDELGPNPRPIEECRITTLRTVGIRLERVVQFTDEELVARRAARKAWYLELVSGFHDSPHLIGEPFRQAWPATFGSAANPMTKSVVLGGGGENEAQDPVSEHDKPPMPSDVPTAVHSVAGDDCVPSLVDLSLQKAIKNAVDTGGSTDFEEYPWFTHKLDDIANILRDYPAFPDTAVTLLSQLIRGWKRNNAQSIDLSGLNLSDSQIAAILPDLDEVRTISLSRNPLITAVSLELVLEQLPHLRRLFIMRCPGITDEDFTSLWCTKKKLFGKLDALYHPLLLNDLRLPPSITLVSTKRFEFSRPTTSPLIASPAAVVQSLIDLWDMFDPQYLINIRGRVYEVIWTTPRSPDRTWDQRGVACSFLGFPWATVPSSFSSWLVVVSPAGYGQPEWAFVPYTVTVVTLTGKAKRKEDEKPNGTLPYDDARATESSEAAGDECEDTESGEADSDDEENLITYPSIQVGAVRTLQEYLHKVVEEDGKLPAPNELVSTLEAMTERLHVTLMKRETVMMCLFTR